MYVNTTFYHPHNQQKQRCVHAPCSYFLCRWGAPQPTQLINCWPSFDVSCHVSLSLARQLTAVCINPMVLYTPHIVPQGTKLLVCTSYVSPAPGATCTIPLKNARSGLVIGIIPTRGGETKRKPFVSKEKKTMYVLVLLPGGCEKKIRPQKISPEKRRTRSVRC